MSSGGVLVLLVRTLNAQEMSAVLSRVASGRPRSVESSASVTVVSACAVFLREFPASENHLVSTYRHAKSNQLISLVRLAIDTGNPVSTMNASPLRCAATRSDRKLSARALVRKDCFQRRLATCQRT